MSDRDRSREGVLAVDPELLGELLGLEAGCRIAGVYFDARTGVLSLTIRGHSMPETLDDGPPVSVRLVVTEMPDGLHASWEHAPNHSWRVTRSGRMA